MGQAILAAQGDPVRRLILHGSPADRRKATLPLGSAPQKGGQKWSFPPDELVVLQLEHSFGGDLKLDSAAENWYREALAFREETRNRTQPEFQPKMPGHMDKYRKLWLQLHPYQKQMVNYLYFAQRAICGDDRGLGKTITSLAATRAVGAKKVLVVAPNYLKGTWRREIADKLSEDAVIASGERKNRASTIAQFAGSSSRFLVVNYEMLRPKVQSGGYPELASLPWDCIIFDEAHRLSGRGTQWIEGIRKFSAVPYQWFLTGNPIDASPENVWQLLNLIDPKKFSSFWAFVEYFCLLEDNFFGKEITGVNPRRMAEFQYALQPYLLHRKKKDVAPHLPNKVWHDIYLEMNPSQKRFYKNLEQHMLIELANGDLELVEVLTAKHLRLQQAIANPAIIGGTNSSCIEDAVQDLAIDIFSSGAQKLIVGTWFVPAADRLEDKLSKNYRVFRVKAEQKNDQRDATIEAFKACKEKAVLVGTIRTMSEGLNIDECDHMIFADKAWTPLPNEQFADRIHRITSTREKHYYSLIVEDSTSADRESVLKNRIEARDEILSMKAVSARMVSRVYNSREF